MPPEPARRPPTHPRPHPHSHLHNPTAARGHRQKAGTHANQSRRIPAVQHFVRRHCFPLPPSPLGRASFTAPECADGEDEVEEERSLRPASSPPTYDGDTVAVGSARPSRRAADNAYDGDDEWGGPQVRQPYKKSTEQMIRELEDFQRWALGVLKELQLRV